MNEYVVWITEETTGKFYFTAENEQDAKFMLEQLQMGNLSLDDFRDTDFKIKEEGIQVDPEEVVELEQFNS